MLGVSFNPGPGSCGAGLSRAVCRSFVFNNKPKVLSLLFNSAQSACAQLADTSTPFTLAGPYGSSARTPNLQSMHKRPDSTLLSYETLQTEPSLHGSSC